MPTFRNTGTRRGISLKYLRQLSDLEENTIIAVRNLNDDIYSL